MKKVKYIFILSMVLISVGCSNFQHKKVDSINYGTIKGDKVKVITYEDGTQKIENLSLKNIGNTNSEWSEGGLDKK